MKRNLIAAATLVMLSGWAQAQLLNSGFELPAASCGTDCWDIVPGPGNTISNWSVGGSTSPDLVSLLNGAAQPGHTAHGGAQFVDVLGSAGPTGGGVFGNWIEQTFSLAAGTYQLSFWLGATTFHDAVVDVTINGVTTLGITTAKNANPTPLSGYENSWQEHKLTFTTPGSTTLRFTGATTLSGDPLSTGIDDVSVTAVPEPSAYLLAIAGLGALGLVSRRRKSRA